MSRHRASPSVDFHPSPEAAPPYALAEPQSWCAASEVEDIIAAADQAPLLETSNAPAARQLGVTLVQRTVTFRYDARRFGYTISPFNSDLLLANLEYYHHQSNGQDELLEVVLRARATSQRAQRTMAALLIDVTQPEQQQLVIQSRSPTWRLPPSSMEDTLYPHHQLFLIQQIVGRQLDGSLS